MLEDVQDDFGSGDYAAVTRHLRSLAEQGDANAQDHLGAVYDTGMMYDAATGEGLPQDYAQALFWYRRAAEQGDADAQYNLGWMYAKGHGVPKDYIVAHMWFSIAASSEASFVRNLSVRFRDQFASKMTPDQIAEAQRLAREWRSK